MGLDLYFIQKCKPETPLNERTPHIEIAYFRKLNALLHWVDTHVSPVENCEDVLITQTQLQNLKDTLAQLTPQNCEELFPTQEGFFYGSTDYDDWYWENIKELQTKVDELLQTTDFDKVDLYFHASW